MSTQPRISAHPTPPHPTPLPPPNETLPQRQSLLQGQSIYRNLTLLHLRILLLPFIVLLQNKHTTLAENAENLISAQPQISAHSQGPKI